VSALPRDDPPLPDSDPSRPLHANSGSPESISVKVPPRARPAGREQPCTTGHLAADPVQAQIVLAWVWSLPLQFNP
jgi:hypothetical protein